MSEPNPGYHATRGFLARHRRESEGENADAPCRCAWPYIGTQEAGEPVRCERCRRLVSPGPTSVTATPQQSPENGAALAAYTIACPRCRSAAGDPCRERYCRNGYAGCTYKACSRIRDLPEPHVARVARAAARVTPPEGGRLGA